MTTNADLQRAIAMANVLRRGARVVADRAVELWLADELSNEDYERVSATYLETLRRIQQITITASRAAAADLGPFLDDVEWVLDELEANLDKVDRIKDVLTIITKMLTVAATIAVALVAPYTRSAARWAIGDLVQTWVAVAGG
jgi:hypothetical protein